MPFTDARMPRPRLSGNEHDMQYDESERPLSDAGSSVCEWDLPSADTIPAAL